jgi:hypothetical protein
VIGRGWQQDDGGVEEEGWWWWKEESTHEKESELLEPSIVQYRTGVRLLLALGWDSAPPFRQEHKLESTHDPLVV